MPNHKQAEMVTLTPPPNFIEPHLLVQAKEVPTSKIWIHEIKYDGYRMLARLDQGNVKISSRTGIEWTHKFRLVAQELTRLPATNLFLDGEMVAQKEMQVSLPLLRKALREGKQGMLHYYVFDLLYLDGQDLRQQPLVERKKILKKLLKKAPPHIHYVDSVAYDPRLLEKACELEFEGIVSKRASSTYRSGQHNDWLKIKCGPLIG